MMDGLTPAPATAAAPVPAPVLPVEFAPGNLTPDEQMARFAKELKENDWGHQPC